MCTWTADWMEYTVASDTRVVLQTYGNFKVTSPKLLKLINNRLIPLLVIYLCDSNCNRRVVSPFTETEISVLKGQK